MIELAELKNFAKIFLTGIYENLERIIFGSGRYTSLEMRNAILTGTVKIPKTVIEELCIGCEGCANVCPTKAIEMIPIEPVKITDNYVKDKIPKINPEKCVYCLYCHDFCPVFSVFNEISPIHPRDVGEEYIEIDISKLLQKKLRFLRSKLIRLAHCYQLI